MTTATKPKLSIAASIQADQEPRRFRELRELLELEAASAVFYVNEYEVNLAYGGPEEGGWHFLQGRFLECHGEARTEADAMDLGRQLEAQQQENNAGRPALTSVRSRGRFAVRIEEHPGADFPQCMPFYE